jgi:hypothetical protein
MFWARDANRQIILGGGAILLLWAVVAAVLSS